MPPSDRDKIRRELCGILYADVVGYSRIMAKSFDEAVRCVETIRGVFAEIVPAHDGEFEVQAGDSFLALFKTVLGAVQSAMDIQRRLAEAPTWYGRPLVIRIGVHMGDVVRSDVGKSSNDINIAARIQDKAAHGGVDVSEDVYRQVRNQDLGDVEFQDLGLRDFKNIGQRQVYRILLGTEVEAAQDEPAQGRTLPEAEPGPGKTPPPPQPQPEPVVPRRVAAVSRRVVIASAVVAALGASAEVLRRNWAGKGTGEGPLPSSPSTTAPAVAPVWPLSIGVMEIKAGDDIPPWMCDFTHKGLNALLSKFEQLKVFSKDVVDWKKEKRTGLADFDIAQELGISRMMKGDIFRQGGKVVFVVRIVAVPEGQEVGGGAAQGTDDQLVAIQNDVGVQIIQALRVPVTKAAVQRVIATRTDVDIDVTKRFAEAAGESGAADVPTAPPDVRWRPWWAAEAYAQTPDEGAVKELLERYRAALQAKDVAQLAALYVTMSDSMREALGRYFDSASDLNVKFSNVNVLFEGDEALATFTRNDKFKDLKTGRDVNLEVQVSTVVARQDGAWKIKAMRKPT